MARESGFRAAPLETVFRLAQLLGQIGERFGDELSLRGGTALNLLHSERLGAGAAALEER